MSRRAWLRTLTGAAAGTAALAREVQASEGQAPAQAPAAGALALPDFEPRSMLHVPETRVERARFPVVDVHTHLTFRARSVGGVGHGDAMRTIATPPDLLPVMDRRNVQTMVNLTGGVGSGLQESVRTFSGHPTRFVVFTEPSWDRIADPGTRSGRPTSWDAPKPPARAASKC